MPDLITMTFTNELNKSLQVGDTIYKSIINNEVFGEPIELGKCTILTPLTITCEIETTIFRPTATDFILFSKDNKANLASIKGYYAEVEMKNDSIGEIELFQIGSVLTESSK